MNKMHTPQPLISSLIRAPLLLTLLIGSLMTTRAAVGALNAPRTDETADSLMALLSPPPPAFLDDPNVPFSDAAVHAPDADAENVEFVGQIGGSTYTVFVEGDYAYIGVGPRLTILDVSNPTFPL